MTHKSKGYSFLFFTTHIGECYKEIFKKLKKILKIIKFHEVNEKKKNVHH